jgi:hypothetical protein
MPTPPHRAFHRTDIWREGKWVDLWSVVHTLSGVSLGFGLSVLHLGDVASVLLVLLLLILYEMWERLMQMEETFANGCMDVVCGMAGFLLTFFLLAPRLSGAMFFIAFGAVFAVNVVMSVFGWRASQKAAELKKRLRARYAKERERLLRHKKYLRERFRRKKV